MGLKKKNPKTLSKQRKGNLAVKIWWKAELAPCVSWHVCSCPQGRCYNGECKTRDNQCQYIWGTSRLHFPARWFNTGFSSYCSSLPVLLKEKYSVEWFFLLLLFLNSEEGEIMRTVTISHPTTGNNCWSWGLVIRTGQCPLVLMAVRKGVLHPLAKIGLSVAVVFIIQPLGVIYFVSWI